MPFDFDVKLPVAAALVLACMAAGSLAADTRPPAGQMCPKGAYVIGFDAASNIVCSPQPGAISAQAPGTAPVSTSGDGHVCPEGCLRVPDEPAADAGVSAVVSQPATAPAAGQDGGGLVISKIKPSGVVFGARETTIRITGSGFTTGTTVKFQGVVYTPTVNPAGTELRVTIGTRDLPMGRYAITISNADGTETTKRRALEVF